MKPIEQLKKKFDQIYGIPIFLAIFLRLILFFLADHRIYGDSELYHNLARVLLTHHQFALPAGSELVPHFVAAPGYPLFLAAIYSITGFGSYQVVILVQIFISCLTVFLTIFISTKLTNRTAGLWAGLFVAISPTSILFTNVALTETLYTVIFLSGISLFLIGLNQNSPLLYYIISSILLVFATYIRPVSLYLFLPVALFLLFASRTYWKQSLIRASVFLAVFLIGILPWFYRNYSRGNAFVFSTLQGGNLLYWRAAGVLEEINDLPRGSKKIGQKLQTLEEKHTNPSMSQAERAQVQRKLAMDIIISHPIAYIKVAAKGSFYMLYGPGRGYMRNLLTRQKTKKSTSPLKRTYNFGFTLYAIFTLVYLGILYLSFCFGIRQFYRTNKKKECFFILLVIIYVVAVSSGPESFARFRVPLIPLFSILAGPGILHGYDFLTSVIKKSIFQNRGESSPKESN